jgi:hypothetical protein
MKKTTSVSYHFTQEEVQKILQDIVGSDKPLKFYYNHINSDFTFYEIRQPDEC